MVNNNAASLSAKLGLEGDHFTVNNVWTQVVAGTNYFLHLTAGNGHKYSAVIYVPLPHTNAPAEVALAEPEHTEPRNQNSW